MKKLSVLSEALRYRLPKKLCHMRRKYFSSFVINILLRRFGFKGLSSSFGRWKILTSGCMSVAADGVATGPTKGNHGKGTRTMPGLGKYPTQLRDGILFV
jgi:hypothetical protein